MVSLDVRGPSPPALPSVPPVGPPPLMRICGRKRLTADQKIRSYSEPENMNEVGVLDNEAAPLFWHGGGKGSLCKETDALFIISQLKHRFWTFLDVYHVLMNP